MHVISRKSLRTFWERHVESEQPLRRWYKVMTAENFASVADLQATFPSADVVGDLIVFNVGGNKFRLLASIHFNRQKVYVRQVLTHAEYDRGMWKS